MFEHQLNDLQDEIVIMGSMVQKAIARSVEAILNRDFDLAESVVNGDEQINEKRFAIEEKCTTLIATQQPMARDLRTILSSMHIVTDLERMGDYAAGIAEITQLLRDDPLLANPPVDIPRMAEIDIQMLADSLDSFVARDADRAREVGERDDEVDALYHKVLSKRISAMIEDPKTVTFSTRMIWVAHKLERIADRVTNICERVIFTVTGQMEEIGVHD